MKPGGIFIPTIRPLEFWKYNDTVRGTSHADTLLKDHAREGFAYLPHNGTEGETYGDITLDIDFLARPGWEILARDRSLVDPYQLAVILRAV